MAEPKAEIDLSPPFESVKAAVSMFGEKIPAKTPAPPHPHSQRLPHVPSLQYVGSYHGPNHQAEKIFALETELHRAHAEINNYKQQLADSEATKNETLKQTSSLPLKLSDDAHWEDHLDAILGQQSKVVVPSTAVTADTAGHHMEFVRLQKELESSKSQYLSSCTELENAKSEIARLQAEVASGSSGTELESAKDEVNKLQAVVNAAWSQHGPFATELARAMEEIAGLESQLRLAQDSSTDLAHAKDANSVLRADLEASLTELLKTRQEVLRLRGQHGASMSELSNAQQEIEKLQAQHSIAIGELISGVKVEIERLQGDLNLARGNSSTELTASQEQIEKLRAELDAVRRQHGNSSTELGNAKEEILNLQARLKAWSAHHEDYTNQLTSSREEIGRLQNELLSFQELNGSSSAEVAAAREQHSKLQVSEEPREISRAETQNAVVELEAATEQLAKLHSEQVTTLMELSKQREAVGRLQNELVGSSRQVLDLREEIGRLQADLVVAEFGGPPSELSDSREEIESLKAEVQRLTDAHAVSSREVDNVDFGAFAAVMDELTMELMATNEHLEKATAARMKAEMDLAFFRAEAEDANTLRAEVQSIQVELKVAKEAERRLGETMRETEEMRAQLAALKESEEKAANVAVESNEGLLSLNAALGMIRDSEQELSKLVEALRSEVEGLKTELAASKESEGQLRESYESTRAELEKVSSELSRVREAEEMASGIVASSSAELHALTAELHTTREGEARAKAAFADYSLKLQRMRTELEDATKIAEKARAFMLDLDEANAKLKNVMESERNMSASMASLRAEVTNARAEIEHAREEGEAALAEKEQQTDMEMTRMRAEWEAAVSEEAKLKGKVTELTDALAKLTDESRELKTAAALSKEEAATAKQQLEQARSHIETIESKLQAALLEVEVVKASEESALSQVKFSSRNPYAEAVVRELGAEVTIPHEEYRALARKAREVEELANKRVAMAKAQVDAAKAGEKEMQSKLEMARKDIEACRYDLREATKKREEAEAAKSAVEAMLRYQRGERRHQAYNGHNAGSPMGSPSYGGDRLGYMRSPASGNSQNSSPLHPVFSFPVFPSPSFQDKPARESLAEVLATKLSSGEKQRKTRFSSKLGSYFVKRKDLGPK